MSPAATSPIIKRRIAILRIQDFSYEANAPHGDTDHSENSPRSRNS